MINYNEEYFQNNCYFFIKDRGSKISLYYSVYETLSESRKKEDKKDFSKKNEKQVKSLVSKFLNSKKKISKKDLDRELDSINSTGEIDELIDSEGGFLGSKTPIVNQVLTPKKTMDQTVVMARTTNDPVTRGYRVYYGEGTKEKGNVVSEVDFSDAFGYVETKDKDFKETLGTLKKMGIDDPEERLKRTKQLGKLPNAKKQNGKLRQRLSEKDSIEEQQRKKMVKMVEDILTKKSKDNSDVIGSETAISKILVKNLQSIKKIAEKEGISLNQLIKSLKTDE
jgi:hypothetical protein